MNISLKWRNEWENFKARLKNRHADRKGFMVEVLLAIVIVGAIAIAAYTQFDKGRMKTNIINTQNTVTLLRTGIQGIYRGQEYKGLDATVLKAANVMNKEQWRGETAYNAWSGLIEVDGADGTFFTITLTKLPQEACMSLAQNGNDWLEVDVNGEKKETEKLPFPAADAAKACSPEADNTIMYTSS